MILYYKLNALTIIPTIAQMGLYTSAHYKNSPNDLQMLSDAPAHAVFCLLSPSAEQDSDSLPDVLAVVQVSEVIRCTT